MKNIFGKGFSIFSCFLLVVLVSLGFFALFGNSSHAAESIIIRYEGQDLEDGASIDMRKGSILLTMRSTGNVYTSDDYIVEWSIPDAETRDKVASITQVDTNKMQAIVKALAPGSVDVTVTVKNNVSDEVMATAQCTINVIFAVATDDDSIYKPMYDTDPDAQRSLFLYASDDPVQLGLNIGEASDAQWTSDNEEVAEVAQDTGVLTPRGAGRATVTASYIPPNDPSARYTALLNVYIIPRASVTNDSVPDGAGFQKTIVNHQMSSGDYLYTDTLFTSNSEAVRNKITWVVKQSDSNGNPVVLANSMGLTSDLISVVPADSNMYTNQLQVTGTAGNYYIEFYASGTYSGEGVGEKTTAYTPTVVSFTLTARVSDKEETLGPGDSYDLPAAFGMTLEDFNACFEHSWQQAGGGAITNYGSYDRSTGILTLKRDVSEGTLIDTMKVLGTKKSYLAKLMGISEDQVPSGFTVTVRIEDKLRISATTLTLSKGATQQLFATYNGTYDTPVKWTSSNEKFVAVDENGNVTGNTETTSDVIVTASLTNSAGVTLTADCLVRVEPALSSFKLVPSDKEITMFVGDTLTIRADIKQNITNAPLTWECSTVNSNVFTVAAASDKKSAVITATGTGTADLVVTNTVNDNKQTIRIIVKSSIQTISLKYEDLTKARYLDGYNMKGDVSYTPANATDNDLLWTSSDNTIATVDAEGYITFVNAGVTLITVRPANNPKGVMATCLLTIVGSATSIQLSTDDVTIDVGSTASVDVTYLPINTLADLTWTTTGTDKDCINIDYNEEKKVANITGKDPGETTINIISPQTGVNTIHVIVKQPSTSVSLSPKSLNLKSGESEKVIATLSPANSTDTLVWSSLNTSVAQVDENGLVTAVKEGTTFIRVQAFNGQTMRTTEIIQVVVQDGLKGVTLDSLSKTIKVGEKVTLEPIFNPKTAYDKTMTWKTADSSIASIATSGESNVVVTGVKAGVTLITGTAKDGGYTVSCLVTVEGGVTKEPTAVSVSPKTKYLAVGKSFTIKATVTGSTTNKKVKWKSSKKKVATVSSKGKVKGKKIGTAYITATAKDGSGASARCKVRVVRKVKKLTLNKYTAKMLVGSTLKLKAKYKPKNATVKSVKWTSDNKEVATVSSDGRVLALAEGQVKITATTKDGSKKKATCLITVSEPVDATGVTVANSTMTLPKGRSAQCGIVAQPANTTTSIRYFSDNTGVATVDSNGKITAKAVGQATIYGETANGMSGYVEVTVVDLNRKGLTMRQYDTEQLHVNDIDTGVTWYSKNINIATVTATGLVTGRKKGTTTIYAVVNGVKLGCRVKIKKIK